MSKKLQSMMPFISQGQGHSIFNVNVACPNKRQKWRRTGYSYEEYFICIAQNSVM